MALPKLVSSKYTLTIPSTGEVVEYRPYLVKEEKVLMTAFESKDKSQMIAALRDTIAGCTEGKVNIDTLAIFDFEYIFLKLRSKSVGETSKIGVKCTACDTRNEVEVNLEEVNVSKAQKKNNKVELTDEVGIMLRYPTVKGLYKQLTHAKTEADQSMATIVSAIESIYDAENVYASENETEKSLMDFLDSLTADQFKKISAFFTDMPKLKHDVKFDCIKCSEKNSITLEGLENFF
jgi:hypothetical protein